MTPDELRRQRIGVVFAGGGAKGAYQIGCWQALRAAGVEHFAAVSGTSVGALTAILAALGLYDSAEILWENLRFGTVVAVRPLRFVIFPMWAFVTLGRLLKAPERDWAGRWFIVLLSLFMLDFLWYATPATTGPDPLVTLFVYCIVGWSALSIFSVATRWVALRWIATTNTPLAAIVAAELTPERLAGLATPTFATLSRFRPDLPGYWAGWTVEYVRLDRLSRTDMIAVLLQSAGIPGVFPVRNVLGSDAIDGGWCDNVPLAPLLFDPAVDLDLIFVLHLSQTDHVHAYLRDTHRGISKITYIKDGALDPVGNAGLYWRAHLRHLGEPYAEDRSRRLPRIIDIVPSEPLGNFLTGTLNFAAAKARKLRALGAADMRRELAALAGEAASAAASAAPSASPPPP